MPTPRRAPDQTATIAALLGRSGRTAVPIRKTFIQQGKGRIRVPGPLRDLAHARDHAALDLYLLIHALASHEPWDASLFQAAWARALRGSESATAKSSVSKALGRLVDLNLVERERDGRKMRITLLHEDGSGADYSRPVKAKDGLWLNLPHEYWTEGWHLKLGARQHPMRAKTLLLISLSLADGFYLVQDHSQDWYGLSPDFIGGGLADLRDAGLLDAVEDYEQAPLSLTGWVRRDKYTLKPPFGPLLTKSATITALHPASNQASA